MLSDKILLIKYNNLNQEYYARKFNSNYLEYKFLGLVNKNNKLMYICTSPRAMIKNFEDVTDELKEKTQYTIKAFDKRFKDETIYFHYFLPSFKTSEPILLDKKVRGLRYANNDEKQLITDEIVMFWCDYKPITLKERLHHSQRYQEIYKKCMEYECIDGLFRTEE